MLAAHRCNDVQHFLPAAKQHVTTIFALPSFPLAVASSGLKAATHACLQCILEKMILSCTALHDACWWARCMAHTHKVPEGDEWCACLLQCWCGRWQVQPSLLHGDLWSGNLSTVKGGGWAILDPATYYGHHEAEFGMSWCGGFSGSFWDGYNSVIPRAPGTSLAQREWLCLW